MGCRSGAYGPALVAGSATVNFSDALEICTDTILVTKHFLYSVRAAIAIVTNLQHVLETGPWPDTHIVTHEQWLVHEEEMRKWLLDVRDNIRALGDETWKCDEWRRFHYLDRRLVFNCSDKYEDKEQTRDEI